MRKLTYVSMLASAMLIVGIQTGAFVEPHRTETGSTDEVVASFHPSLAREPGETRRTARKSIDNDVLYRTANAIHWTAAADVDVQFNDNEQERTNAPE